MRSILFLFLIVGFFSLSSSKCTNECKERIKTDCFCDTVNEPVCGCNNVTYSNSCIAECSSIIEYISGPCCTEIQKEDCICTLEYDPVCGCNSKTYGNACAASCASIEIISQGKCP